MDVLNGKEATIITEFITQTSKSIETGKQFPPANHIERLAKYQRGKAIFDGNLYEVYERAAALLRDTPAAPQLKTLYIACNIVDVLLTKPSDLLVGEPPSFESGKPDDSTEQKALNSIVEENDLTARIHEMVIGAGYRGDSFVKVRYDYAQDFSALPEGFEIPTEISPQAIIEPIDAATVFPELSRGSKKRFKAINIAWVEWVESRNGAIIATLTGEKYEARPYLNVERHLPGYIVYERYELHERGVDTTYGVPIATYTLGKQVGTGREKDVVPTGVARPLVFHIPYKSLDDRWEGVSGIEKIESLLAAINDRLVQIDYILWKHSDPTAYGPDIDEGDGVAVRTGGKYIPVGKDDVTPGYMVWNSQLDGAFKELNYLLGMVFQMSETPQWLFGTTLAGDTSGGSGTSHTDSGAIKARFMPILAKVNRIRVHVDKAIRDALWTAMELENYANQGVEGFESYEAIYPKINWRDGIPVDEKEQAEIASIRTGGKPTIDVHTAIKRLDSVDDSHAKAIMTRIASDERDAVGTVTSSIYNGGDG